MSKLTKEEKLRKILEKVESKGITSYYVAKNTALKESGLTKLFAGKVKNPHDSTVNTLYEFLYGNSDAVNTITGKETITVGEYEVTLEEYDMAFYKNKELILSKCKITSLIIDGEANKKFKKVLEDNNIEVEYVPKGRTTA